MWIALLNSPIPSSWMVWFPFRCEFLFGAKSDRWHFCWHWRFPFTISKGYGHYNPLLKKKRKGREDLLRTMKLPNQQGKDLQISILWERPHHLGEKKGLKVPSTEMAHKPVSKLKILIQNLNLLELAQHLWTLLSIQPGGVKLMRMLKLRT